MNYTLATNELLAYITQKLETEKPDWDKVIYNYRQLPVSKDITDAHEIAGMFAELCLRASLEKICSEFPGRVVFNPIADGQAAGEFIAHSTGRGTIRFENGLKRYEADEILVVDGLPVLFEVTLAYDYVVNQRVKERYISHRLNPLSAYFQTEKFGYVLVALTKRMSENLLEKFREMGGVFVPFYADGVSFRTELLEVAEKYGIRIEESRRDGPIYAAIRKIKKRGISPAAPRAKTKPESASKGVYRGLHGAKRQAARGKGPLRRGRHAMSKLKIAGD